MHIIIKVMQYGIIVFQWHNIHTDFREDCVTVPFHFNTFMPAW
jgi:hypothetical protein